MKLYIRKDHKTRQMKAFDKQLHAKIAQTLKTSNIMSSNIAQSNIKSSKIIGYIAIFHATFLSHYAVSNISGS